MQLKRSSDSSRDETLIVQDNARELLLANLLQLKHMPGRWGHDAEDEHGNHYELKTTTRSGFGTGRDVSPRMISEWRTRYWVCAQGRNLRSGFIFDEIHFLSPGMLEEWFSTLEARFAPDEKLRDLAIERLRDSVKEEDLRRVEYLFNRGMTYNNPHIGRAYVKAHGVSLGTVNPADKLRALVTTYPIKK